VKSDFNYSANQLLYARYGSRFMKWWIALLLTTLATSSVQADEKCTLQKVATVPLTVTPSGTVTVPVIVAGDPLTFALSINDGFSAISSDYAEKRGLHLTSNLPSLLHFDFLVGTATASDVMVGDLALKNVQFLRGDVTKHSLFGVSGTIGLNVLENYDVELDFKDNRLNLYSQNHCPGDVVYWSSAYTVIPFTQDAAGNLIYQLKLDGKLVTAGFNLFRGFGFISSEKAQEVVGLTTLDGLTKTPNLVFGINETYIYPFQTLEFGAFTFKQPEIYVYPGKVLCRPSHVMRCLGVPDIVVGSDQLRKLHLFYVFKEGKLCVTTADAHL